MVDGVGEGRIRGLPRAAGRFRSPVAQARVERAREEEQARVREVERQRAVAEQEKALEKIRVDEAARQTRISRIIGEAGALLVKDPSGRTTRITVEQARSRLLAGEEIFTRTKAEQARVEKIGFGKLKDPGTDIFVAPSGRIFIRETKFEQVPTSRAGRPTGFITVRGGELFGPEGGFASVEQAREIGEGAPGVRVVSEVGIVQRRRREETRVVAVTKTGGLQTFSSREAAESAGATVVPSGTGGVFAGPSVGAEVISLEEGLRRVSPKPSKPVEVKLEPLVPVVAPIVTEPIFGPAFERGIFEGLPPAEFFRPPVVERRPVEVPEFLPDIFQLRVEPKKRPPRGFEFKEFLTEAEKTGPGVFLSPTGPIKVPEVFVPEVRPTVKVEQPLVGPGFGLGEIEFERLPPTKVTVTPPLPPVVEPPGITPFPKDVFITPGTITTEPIIQVGPGDIEAARKAQEEALELGTILALGLAGGVTFKAISTAFPLIGRAAITPFAKTLVGAGIAGEFIVDPTKTFIGATGFGAGIAVAPALRPFRLPIPAARRVISPLTESLKQFALAEAGVIPRQQLIQRRRIPPFRGVREVGGVLEITLPPQRRIARPPTVLRRRVRQRFRRITAEPPKERGLQIPRDEQLLGEIPFDITRIKDLELGGIRPVEAEIPIEVLREEAEDRLRPFQVEAVEPVLREDTLIGLAQPPIQVEIPIITPVVTPVITPAITPVITPITPRPFLPTPFVPITPPPILPPTPPPIRAPRRPELPPRLPPVITPIIPLIPSGRRPRIPKAKSFKLTFLGKNKQTRPDPNRFKDRKEARRFGGFLVDVGPDIGFKVDKSEDPPRRVNLLPDVAPFKKRRNKFTKKNSFFIEKKKHRTDSIGERLPGPVAIRAGVAFKRGIRLISKGFAKRRR